MVAERFGFGRTGRTRTDQTVETDIQRSGSSLNEAVGVENEGRARRQPDSALPEGIRESEGRIAGLVEHDGFAVGVTHQRRALSRRGIRPDAGSRLEDTVESGDHG